MSVWAAPGVTFFTTSSQSTSSHPLSTSREMGSRGGRRARAYVAYATPTSAFSRAEAISAAIRKLSRSRPSGAPFGIFGHHHRCYCCYCYCCYCGGGGGCCVLLAKAGGQQKRQHHESGPSLGVTKGVFSVIVLVIDVAGSAAVAAGGKGAVGV